MLGAFLGMLISVVTAAVVGVRLLAVARRTRELPELSAGVGLVAFALAQLGGMLMAGLGDGLAPGASQALRGFTLFQFSLTSFGLSLFTVETFGRTAWRWALAASIVVAGVTLRIAILHYEIPILSVGTPHSAIPSIAALTFSLGFVWLGIEGLQYHRRARRAYWIGLASAQVVSRFLVLGVGGLVSGLLATAAAVTGLLDGSLVGLGRLFIVSSGLVTAVVLVLAFVPPAAYRNFIEARAARREASHA